MTLLADTYRIRYEFEPFKRPGHLSRGPDVQDHRSDITWDPTYDNELLIRPKYGFWFTITDSTYHDASLVHFMIIHEGIFKILNSTYA